MDKNEDLKRLLMLRRNLKRDIKILKGQTSEMIKELAATESKIKALTHKNRKRLNIVEEYNTGLPWKMKVLFALGKIGEGTISEIQGKLEEYDDGIKNKTAYQSIQKTLLRLTEELKVIKTGQYNSRYKLNMKA